MENKEAPARSYVEIENWISSYLVENLEVESTDIDVNAPFETFGIDSITMVEISYDVGKWLGIEIDPKLLYHYTSIATVSTYLEKLVTEKNG